MKLPPQARWIAHARQWIIRTGSRVAPAAILRGPGMLTVLVLLVVHAAGCGNGEARPVEIYPEDMCAHCRMAVSDQRFACELITAGGEAMKFDDIGCMDSFLTAKAATVTVVQIFYRDYAGAGWVKDGAATVVETNVMTPMGSGKVAFADAQAAADFQREHPRGDGK